MRSIVLIVACMLMSVVSVSAQNYVVRTVSGVVMLVDGKKKTAVREGQILSRSSVLEIRGKASLVIEDKAQGGKTYEFRDNGQRSVGKRQNSGYPEIKVLAKGYFSEVVGNVATAQRARRTNSEHTATSHRGADSLICEPVQCDSIATDTIENPM